MFRLEVKCTLDRKPECLGSRGCGATHATWCNPWSPGSSLFLLVCWEGPARSPQLQHSSGPGVPPGVLNQSALAAATLPDLLQVHPTVTRSGRSPACSRDPDAGHPEGPMHPPQQPEAINTAAAGHSPRAREGAGQIRLSADFQNKLDLVWNVHQRKHLPCESFPALPVGYAPSAHPHRKGLACHPQTG